MVVHCIFCQGPPVLAPFGFGDDLRFSTSLKGEISGGWKRFSSSRAQVSHGFRPKQFL